MPGPNIVLPRPRAPGLGQRRAARRIAGDAHQRGGETFRIVRIDRFGRAGGELGQAPARGDQQRRAGRHRLQRGQAEGSGQREGTTTIAARAIAASTSPCGR